MSWRPVVRDFVQALVRPLTLAFLGTVEMIGTVRGGPYRAILDGLIMFPAIWALSPAGWPWLRLRLRHHRRTFGLAPVAMPPDGWRLPATIGIAVFYLAELLVLATVFHDMGEVVSPWWWLTAAGLLLATVLLCWEMWIFYALERRRRQEELPPTAIVYQRTLRLLSAIEGRSAVPHPSPTGRGR